MAIEFDCPHCGHHYRLKDELAGKAAACKNCRKKIIIPQPVAIPDDPPPAPVDVEAAAVAALADAPKVEEDQSKKVIPVECNYCGQKWIEPISRAGKNALCPNPECRQRIKIPEPKDEGQYDWRQTRTKGPSLAKQNNEKLEGVQDAAETKQVSGQALKEAGAIDEGIEPRPLKQKVLFAVLGVGLVAGTVFGVMYAARARTEGKEHRLMAEALEGYAKAAESLPKDEQPLGAAVLHIAAGEYALRYNDREHLLDKEGALEQFGKAQSALRPLSSPARHAIMAELAVAVLALGGTEEDARKQFRIRWTPDVNLKTRPNEHLFTVHEELRKVLGALQGAPVDFRMTVARRLTRDLVKRGQPGLAVELIPLALFAQAEQPEAKAVVALEVYRADKSSKYPADAAKELAARAPDLARAIPKPASVQTLFTVLKTEKAPATGIPAPGTGAVTDDTRTAYTGVALLEDRPADALALAQRPGLPEQQLRALALCADWSADPAPALSAAVAILPPKESKGEKVSPFLLLRLAQLAAAAGKHEYAKQFADAIPDEGLRAWAKGDAVRLRLAAAPTEKGDEAWAELPKDERAFRAGQGWGRLWLARHNTRIGGSRSEHTKAVNAWPAPFPAFGKAGVALGLQDREK